MNNYSYTAIDADGNIEHGTIESTDLASAIAQLAERNLVAQSIALRDQATVAKERQSSAFESNLRQLLARREEWKQALNAACSELPHGPTRRELLELTQQLSSSQGDRPLVALLRQPAMLELLPLLENSDNKLGGQEPLRKWLGGMLKKQQLRTQYRKRLTYPVVLIGLTLLILCGFAYFLIPLFRDMFNEFGLTLPPPTILVFWLAEQTTTYLFRSLAVIFCLMLIIIPFVRYWRSRSLSNRLFGRLVAGTSSNLLAMASLANTLSHMLRLGAPLNEALRIAGTASRCYFYQRAAIELSNQIEQSANVAPKLSSRVLPPLLLYALQAESSGSPSLPMLESLAQIYSDRAQCRVDLLTTMLPVLALLVIGFGVGFVVISLFMPLVSMVTSLA